MEQDSRPDHWIQTFSGRLVHVFRPELESNEYVIEDIAHALANICRFTGHLRTFYSVAQHSVLVSYLCPPELALAGLLHDASEAYCNDMASPLKSALPDYKNLEDGLERAIYQAFDLPFPKHPMVKRADSIALATEARDLMANAPTLWRLPEKPIRGIKVDPWLPAQAEAEFLSRFREVVDL
jgi:hypothetical protein